MSDTLEIGEPHPSAFSARDWIYSIPYTDLIMWQESFSSCAISGNRLAEICSGTLSRLLSNQPVSDRYLLGLAWAMREGDMDKKKSKVKRKRKVKNEE